MQEPSRPSCTYSSARCSTEPLEDSLLRPKRMQNTPKKATKRSSESPEESSAIKILKYQTESLKKDLKILDDIMEANIEMDKRPQRALKLFEKLTSSDSTSMLSSNLSCRPVCDQAFAEVSNISAEEEQQISPSKNLEDEEKEQMEANNAVLNSLESELCCSVCTELFVKATTLECLHTFCAYCLEEWQKLADSCPLCRTTITFASSNLNIDHRIKKIVAQRSPEEKESRKQLIEERTKSAQRKTVFTSEKRIVPGLPRNPQRFLDVPLVDRRIIRQIISEEGEESVGINTYYGGYGRCYNCGDFGHWQATCPIM